MKVPEYTTKLWTYGLAPKVLITGNYGQMRSPDFDTSEAEVFARNMRKNGVPNSAIITESKATNTGENVRFGMNELEKNNIFPKSLLLVARPFCMRRCVATFKKQFPNIKAIACPVPGSIMDFVDRPKSEFALRLVAELNRLKEYPKQGFITPVQIPDNISELAVKIRDTFR